MTFSDSWSDAFQGNAPLPVGPLPYSHDYNQAYAGGVWVWYTIPSASLGENDLTERPEYPPYPTLWERYRYPTTPVALLLWKDGTVQQVDSLYTEGFMTADRAILGGYVFLVRSDGWEIPVLENAGYTLEYAGSPL